MTKVEYLVESPKRLRSRIKDIRQNIDNGGPVITGVRVHITSVGGKNSSQLEFVLQVALFGMTAEGMRVVPYSSEPSSEYAPVWYRSFVEEAKTSFTKRMQKKNTVQNPFVVEILPGNFPDGTQPTSFQYPVPELPLAPTNPEANPEEETSDKPNYQAGVHVSTALNLWEWLRTRSSSVEYAGAPTWKPGQFICIARRPEDGIGKPVNQYDVFMILEPRNISITVAGDLRTGTSIGYVGLVDMNLNRYENLSPMWIDMFREKMIL